MKRSTKIALGGMITGLCIMLMFMTGLFPFATYALPALAGLILVAMVVEFGSTQALIVYVAVSILSIFMTPDREAAIMFICFFGHYPIIKVIIERRIPNRILEWVVKLLTFNACIVLGYLFVINVMGISEVLESFGDFGKYSVLVLLALGNVVFVIYDFALTRVISMYIHWFRPKFLRKIK